MKIRNMFLIIAVIISCSYFFTSCIFIVPISGIRQHFDDLSEEERHSVVWTNRDDTLKNIKNDGRIYAITGNQLSDMLSDYPQALVYEWSPTCKSDKCVSLNYIQHFCDENSVELFVVVDSFQGAFTQITELTQHPLFVRNSLIYGSKRSKVLCERFYIDLLGNDIYEKHKDELRQRYLYFENGDFVKVLREPSELATE